MPTVTNTIVDPTGAPVTGAAVLIALVTASGPGYTGTTTVEGTWSTSTDATGTWSVNLPANSTITQPAGTYYQVTETPPFPRTPYISYAQVPNGAGPYQLTAILVGAPAAPTAQYVAATQVGAAGGVASLDNTDNVPAAQLGHALLPTVVTAKGDLIAATAPATVARVGVGSDGQALLADSTQAAGLRWGSIATSANVNYRGAWAPSTVYAVDDAVTLSGELLVCATAHTSGATFALADWTRATGDPATFDVILYGAVGDGQVVTDGAMTAASATLTSASGKFAAADVGKHVLVLGAAPLGVTSLVTTISAYISATSVTLAAAATETVTGAYVLWATDDQPAVQAAINAAVAYAAAHGGAAQVVIPDSPGGFYGLAAMNKGGGTAGNAHIALPVVAATADKLTITISGPAPAAQLFHWQQGTPQRSGATLVSFGAYASTSAQVSDINANGNPAIVGAPNQAYGYGTSALLFSNIAVVLRNVALVGTYASYGLGYGGFDLSGAAEAQVIDCAVGTAATYTQLQTVGPLANGQSIGALMPANGNNDLCVVRNLSLLGGHTFGLHATEHCVITALRITYCWAALSLIGTYYGSAGASHAVHVDQFSCETCDRHVNVIGSGQNGVGPTIHVTQLDTEGLPVIYDASNGGAGGYALGDISVTGYQTPSVPNPTGIRVRNLVQQPGYVPTPSYALGTPFANPFWRDATVVITGGTVTGVKVGAPTAGKACLGGTTAPAMQATGITAGTVRVPAGGWLEIDGAAAPTCAWILD